MLARVHEKMTSSLPDVESQELLREFLELDNELRLMQTLRGLNGAKSDVTDKRNSILIFSPDGDLEVKSFRDATDALRALFVLEKQMPDRDIVLVRADTSEEVRLAFRNYFKDAREFVRLVDHACTSLSGRRVGKMRTLRKGLPR
jgi:hypothetical protein